MRTSDGNHVSFQTRSSSSPSQDSQRFTAQRRCLPTGCIAIARGCHNNINPELLEHNEHEGKINDPFHINTSRMGTPHAHRVIAGVMNLTVLFFLSSLALRALPCLASPRLAGWVSTLQPRGPFSNPHLHFKLHLRPTRPSGLRGY